MSKRLARRYPHPGEMTLAVLGGKWTTVILTCLKNGECRYCELRRRLPGLSTYQTSNSGLMATHSVAHDV
jgi:DNA-binding HxlR family transcriptional regulator